jgi:membrane protein insertase Oxa1/YidC/SpoIIIJ
MDLQQLLKNIKSAMKDEQGTAEEQDLAKIQRTAERILLEIRRGNAVSKQQMFKGFMVGIFYALGATFGFALLIAVVTFLVKILGGLPVVGNWFVHLGGYLHQ